MLMWFISSLSLLHLVVVGAQPYDNTSFACPTIDCPPTPDPFGKFCAYGEPAIDITTGCPTSCGPLVRCCPLPTPCARPPDNCNYGIRPPPDADGCVVGCGRLVCDPKDECPIFSCAAPSPETGCVLDTPDYSFDTGCPLGCGGLICDGDGTTKADCPALPQCARPPPFCTWSGPATDAMGCIIGCGSLVCDSDPVLVNNTDTSCPPVPLCAAPLAGCNYIDIPTNNAGCLLGCGTLFCCPDLVCQAPDPGCSYGPRTFNDQGCPVSCGDLTCEAPVQSECTVCDEPCKSVQCSVNRRCVTRKPVPRINRKTGCPNCPTKARCVRNRPRPRRPFQLLLRRQE